MAATLKGIVLSSVLLSFIHQGVHGFEVFHRENVVALVGQDVFLPCTPKEDTHKILQIEWRKKGEPEDQKLVVFNPRFGETLHNPNVTLKSEKDREMKTTLVIKAVKEKDTGRYICEMTTYPSGSIRKVSRLKVKDLNDVIQCDANRTIEAESGHIVSVNCTADGFHNILFRWTKDNKWISDEASLVIRSLSKQNAGLYMLTVTVGNNTALVTRRKFNLTVVQSTTQSGQGSVTTGYTTGIPALNVTLGTMLLSTGTNVTGPTGTSTNQMSEQTEPGTEPGGWANLTVTPDLSTPPTIQPVTSSVTVTTPVTQLMNVTTDLSVNTEERTMVNEVNSSTHNPTGVPTTAQSQSTYSPVVQSNESTTWSNQSDGGQGNTSELETSSGVGQGVTSTITPERSTLTGVEETRVTHTSFTLSDGSGVTIDQEPSRQRYAIMLWIIPFLVLLILVGILYRRHVIQKNMDKPPSFKPPPPPVKYSSLNAQDIPMTDIIT
ncbi:hypothetical protein DPEC_G00230210 [Dallia pectoralis]|uniref:Uncharacterized protein n=1 Tax=Dallia pectoralis TaxID=75939 RepID=A0ACC2G1D6_DALPE|nr:hypothetical protein DPEC_G00230210 [Dallia pectoralis]